ncbi:MAG: hypothetical protein K0S18_105 [Anaerocolumna sp.]|jgi:hypothetical protein|nr:hypothetical protein [Anaerocolumna sp.]
MNKTIKINKDEYIVTFESTGKYWVGNSDGSISNNGMLSEKLTEEESKLYTHGKNKKFGFDVFEFGHDIYIHRETGDKIELPKLLS